MSVATVGARAPWAWRLADGTIVGMNVIGLRVRPGACHRCRFLADFVLKLLVDKVAPELLVLDCAAEAGTTLAADTRCADTGATARGQLQNLVI